VVGYQTPPTQAESLGSLAVGEDVAKGSA